MHLTLGEGREKRNNPPKAGKRRTLPGHPIGSLGAKGRLIHVILKSYGMGEVVDG